MAVDRYGYFYSLVEGVPWGPGKYCPSPSSRHTPRKACSWMAMMWPAHSKAWEALAGATVSTEEETRMVQALWDYACHRTTYPFYTGLDQVLACDWMGNQAVAHDQ